MKYTGTTPEVYTSRTYVFSKKSMMLDFMRSMDVLPYKDHTAQTVTGQVVGFWNKIVTRYYFVHSTSGNLSQWSVS